MGIVIDNSGSMREKREKVNKAALDLVSASNQEDQVFVVNFNDEYYLDQDFTGSVKLLKMALEKVEARGGTALYDAMVASAEQLKSAKLQKKVLFVVTDGEDNASRSSLEQAVRWLQEENGPTVYAIGLLGGEEGSRRAKRALETLAVRTGGIAFLPKTVDQVDEISRTVAHDIRSQYTIGYRPPRLRASAVTASSASTLVPRATPSLPSEPAAVTMPAKTLRPPAQTKVIRDLRPSDLDHPVAAKAVKDPTKLIRRQGSQQDHHRTCD